jgi:hypothetical protein
MFDSANTAEDWRCIKVDWFRLEECPFLFDLTDKDWAEIRQVAMHLLDTGYSKGDQFTHMKCSVAAFMWWSEHNQIIAEIQKPDKASLH